MSFKRVSLWFSSLVKVEGKILSSLDLQTMAWKEAISSIMTKIEMAKNIHLQMLSSGFLKKPQKLTKSSPSIWHLLHNVKLTVKISSIFVAFLEL